MTNYRYIFNSLRDERVLEEIDLYGVYMDMALNVGGQFDGTFQLDQTGKRNEDLLAATVPGRTYVVVERNSVPIGAWYIWSRVYSAQSKTIQLHGQSFDNYPKKQRVLTDLTYSNTEQREIFKQLWTHMQSVFARNINVNVPTGVFPTVVPKTVTVRSTEEKYYSEVMSSLANASDGFDWYVAVTKEGNYYRKDLLIGYPTIGAAVGATNLIFEFPGTVTQYYMTESMTDAGTNILTVGAGEGSSMIKTEVVHSDLLNTGMPRWDVDVARKDIESQSLLNTVGAQEGLRRRAPMTTLKLKVKGDKVPEFGSYGLGDNTVVVIKDARNPRGFVKQTRLIMWKLHPATSEQVEEADLIFEGDDDNA